jgi:hypothetical protein
MHKKTKKMWKVVYDVAGWGNNPNSQGPYETYTDARVNADDIRSYEMISNVEIVEEMVEVEDTDPSCLDIL